MRYKNQHIFVDLVWIILLSLRMLPIKTPIILMGLTFFLMFLLSRPKYEKRILNRIIIWFISVLMLFVIQNIFILDLNLSKNIQFYFVVYMGIIIYMCIRGNENYQKRYSIALNISLLYLNLSTFYLYSKIGYMRSYTTSGASVNYLAAVNVMSVVYILYQLKQNKKQGKKMRLFSLITVIILILGVFVSGSRASMITVVLAIIGSSKVLKLRLKPRILIVIFISIISLMIVPEIFEKMTNYLSKSISRVIEIFDGTIVLTDRTTISKYAIEELKNANIFIIGKGDNFIYNVVHGERVFKETLAHNFIYEILAHSGVMGLLIFLCYYGFIVREIYRKLKKNKKAMYTCYLILFSGFLISLSQPFLTTGLLFNFVLFSNIYSIYIGDKDFFKKGGLMKIICTPITVYAFLNFILINTEEYSEILFIFQDANPSLKKISERMKAKNMNIEEIKFYNNKLVRWGSTIIKAIICNIKYNGKLVYGQDHSLYTRMIKNDMYLLEDGIGNYVEVKKKVMSKENFFSVLIGKKNNDFGRGNNVKKIYLTGLTKIPEDISHKVEIINLEELWNKKTKEQKKDILEIFGIKEILDSKKYNEKILFLTQPFFEENLLTYEDEIEMYKNILKEYKNEDIIIKPHPLDRKNYIQIFPDYEIMSSEFPFELIKLNKIKFKKVVTIYSTAALNLGEDQAVDFLGTEIHPKLLEKRGKITRETLK